MGFKHRVTTNEQGFQELVVYDKGVKLVYNLRINRTFYVVFELAHPGADYRSWVNSD